MIFDNPKPCAELALFNQSGEILIAKRGKDPYKGAYDLPGGFVDMGEDIETAVLREIAEELGLSSDDFTTPIYCGSTVDVYDWKREIYQVIIMEFVAILKGDPVITASDDVTEVMFVDPEKLDDINFSSPKFRQTIRHAKSVFDQIKDKQ